MTKNAAQLSKKEYVLPLNASYIRPKSLSYFSKKLLSSAAIFLAVTSIFSACENDLIGKNPPLNTPVYPTGIAIQPNGDYLAVVSSNFDGRYNRGALLLAPLPELRAQIAAAPKGQVLKIDNPFTGAAYIPTFGDLPLFTSAGDRMLLATRKENLLLDVGIQKEGDVFSIDCPSREGEEIPDCEQSPFALSLPGNDPYDLLITSQTETEIHGLISFLTHYEVMPFTIDLTSEENQRLKLGASIINLGEDITGVRAMIQIPDTSYVVLATERLLIDNTTLRRVELITFDLDQGANTNFNIIDLDNLVGAQGIRSLSLSSDQKSLFVLTRYPDGIVRFDIDASSENSFPLLNYSGQMETCSSPSRLLPVHLTRADNITVERIFLTCFDDDAVLAIEPNTLTVTDEARFLGEGPFALALDDKGTTPMLFVSYFSSHRIGVFHLLDDEGNIRLQPRAEIGTDVVENPFEL